MTWIINGESVGTASLSPGLPTAYITVTLSMSDFGIPLVIQYGGDGNWSAASVSCTFDAGGGG